MICILLVKEPWNAGHSQVMKAWQDLTGIALDTVVDGDKIFQGVPQVTLKRRYQLYLDVSNKWDKDKEKRDELENEEDRDDSTRSTAQLSCRGFEDLWEEFIMHKENEKEKKEEDLRKKPLQKKVIKRFDNLQWFSWESMMPKVHKKVKDVKIDFELPAQKTPGNGSTSPITNSSSNNGLDFINQHVARSEENQRKGLEIKEKKLELKTKREECKAKEASNLEAEIKLQ